MKRDPLGMVDGPNVLLYVHANPMRFSDDLGLLAIVPIIIIIAVGVIAAAAIYAAVMAIYAAVNCGQCLAAAVNAVRTILESPRFDPQLIPTLQNAGFGRECACLCGDAAERLIKIVWDRATGGVSL